MNKSLIFQIIILVINGLLTLLFLIGGFLVRDIYIDLKSTRSVSDQAAVLIKSTTELAASASATGIRNSERLSSIEGSRFTKADGESLRAKISEQDRRVSRIEDNMENFGTKLNDILVAIGKLETKIDKGK